MNALAKAYEALEEAVIEMGKLKVQYLTGAVHIDTDINSHAQGRSWASRLPVIDTDFKEYCASLQPAGYGFLDRQHVAFL